MRVEATPNPGWRIDYRREFRPKAYFAWGSFAEFEAAGIEFTNGDQPGVRLTKAAAARPAEPGSAQRRRVAAKVVRRKTAKANEKKR